MAPEVEDAPHTIVNLFLLRDILCVKSRNKYIVWAGGTSMQLKIESMSGYLSATVSGKVSMSEALKLFQKVFDVSKEMDLGKILLDCFDVEGDLPTLQGYQLGKEIAEYGLSRSITPKVAVVGVSPVINGFAAQVAWNRGLVVEVFSERQAALNWLNAFDPSNKS